MKPLTCRQLRWDVVDPEGVIKWATEADLRDGLACAAWSAGWYVSTEYDLREWGRIDLICWNDKFEVVVELKTELSTARQVREAVKQATSYKARLDKTDSGAAMILGAFFGPERVAMVVAPKVDAALASRMVDASDTTVTVFDTRKFCTFIQLFGDDAVAEANAAQLTEMTDRHAQLRQRSIDRKRSQSSAA